MLKVSSGNTRTTCKISFEVNNKDAAKLAMETPEQHQYQSDECVLNFEPSSHIVHFEQVNTGWVQPRGDSC